MNGPENQRTGESAGKNLGLDPVKQPINYFLGHNLSLGLMPEAGDLGLNADLRSLVAAPEGGAGGSVLTSK